MWEYGIFTLVNYPRGKRRVKLYNNGAHPANTVHSSTGAGCVVPVHSNVYMG